MKKPSKLSKEEQEILDAYNKGKLKATKSQHSDLLKLQRTAHYGLSKDKRINIRLPSQVLEDLQFKAIEEGIPYQTLISSVLYKFASGRLVDISLLDSLSGQLSKAQPSAGRKR